MAKYLKTIQKKLKINYLEHNIKYHSNTIDYYLYLYFIKNVENVTYCDIYTINHHEIHIEISIKITLSV